RRGLHNELRPHLTQRFIDLLVARYKAAAVRSYQRRDADSAPDNVTSLFDRDSTLDVGVAGALVRGEAPPEGWERELRARRRARGGNGDVESASRVIEELGLEGFTDAATLARRNGAAATNGSDTSNEPRTFGHVLVDEAQDLSAMQWRMLARRCPSGSMTL